MGRVGKSVLSMPERMEVAKLLGWFWKPSDIMRHFKESFNKSITAQAISNYSKSKDWIPVINKFREEYNRLLFEVPLFNKRKRLDELQEQYDLYKSKGDLKTARKIIREFREEAEKKIGDVSFHFTSISHTEYHDMSDEQLREEKVKTLEELEKVRRMKLIVFDPANGGSKNAGKVGERIESASPL